LQVRSFAVNNDDASDMCQAADQGKTLQEKAALAALGIFLLAFLFVVMI
jgi:hypothetical protein